MAIRHRGSALVLLVLLSGVLVGCSSHDAGSGTAVPPTFEATEWIGDSALLEGELRIDGACVTVVTDNAPPISVAFASLGEPTITNGTLNFGGAEYANGAEVSFGGGESGEDLSQITGRENCGSADSWFLVSHQ